MTTLDLITSRLERLASSSYVRAVAVLSTGQFIAALLPLLAAPFLGRLYSPADYGVLGSYMAIATVIVSLSTIQLHQGIIAERGVRRATTLAIACQRLAGIIALVTAGLAVVVAFCMANTPYATVRWWILALPASVAAGGYSTATAALANRFGRYSALARAQIFSTAITVCASLVTGAVHWGAKGLFVSYFVGQAVNLACNIYIFRSIVSSERRSASFKRLFLVAWQNRNFAKFTLTSEMLSNINLQLPIYFLTFLGATPAIGAFSRARQLIGMPMQLLGSSISQVYRQRAADEFRRSGDCREIYRRTVFALLGFGTLPIVALMIFAPDLFALILGDKWRSAGDVARLIGPMLLMRFVCSPVSGIFYFTHNQAIAFRLTVAGLILSFLSQCVAIFVFHSAQSTIAASALSYSIIYGVFLWRGWRLSVQRP